MKVLFQFHIILFQNRYSEMFIDLFSESSEEGRGGRGAYSLGSEDEPIYRGCALDFGYLLQATSVKIHDKLIRCGMPLYLAIFEKCVPRNYCNDY